MPFPAFPAAKPPPSASNGERPSLPAIFHLFGVRIHRDSLEQAAAYVAGCLRDGVKGNMAFVDANCLNKAWGDGVYRAVLNGFDRVYAAGGAIRWACRLRGLAAPGDVNSTDLFPLLCQALERQNASLFLLGGFPCVAEACAQAIQARYDGLRVVGIQHGYFAPEADAAVLRRINASGADVLLVGMGVPEQELWIHRHGDQLLPTVCIGVGGLFDYFSGRIPRAPYGLRKLGLEWGWRLLQEPLRLWRRYLVGGPVFFLRALLTSS